MSSSCSAAAHRKDLKDCIRQFTPAWFAANMGTGAISILFFNFPYATGSQTMQLFTYIFFFLNLVLFILFNVLTAARYILFPDVWSIMIRHSTQSLFLGTYPMGAATLINVAVALINEENMFGGKAFLYAMWGFWWLDVVVSILCAFVLVHVMKTRQDHTLERMTSIWLLPVVTLVVASSSGGVLAPPLAQHSTYHALITLTTSAVLLSMGLTLAFMILTVYLLRLIVSGVPPGAGVLSVFIPLGPMGQGGYSILLLGQNFRTILPLSSGNSPVLRLASVGEIIEVVSLCVGLVLWALATLWFAYALLAVAEVVRHTRVPFQQAFWGIIFPNGVYANLTIQLSRTLDSQFFRVWGAIYAAATLVLWTVVFVRTVSLVHYGQIFESPCLKDHDLARAMEKRNGGGSEQSGEAGGPAGESSSVAF